MRKVIAGIIMIFSAGTLFADNMNMKGKSYVGGHAEFGPQRSEYDGEGISSVTGLGYGAGLNMGYGVLDNGVVVFGTSLQQRTAYYKVRGAEKALEQKYLDMNLSYRFLVNIAYVEGGLFYGVALGAPVSVVDDHETVVSSKRTKNVSGYFIGGGALFNVSDKVMLDIGIRFKSCISAMDKTELVAKPSALSLMFGVNRLF